MLKKFSEYQVIIHSSVNKGLCAQVACYQGGLVGVLNFYVGQKLPKSYLIAPNWPENPNTIFLELSMPMSEFAAIMDILRLEKPLALNLQEVDPIEGFKTEGTYGMLRVYENEPVGEEEDALLLSISRPVPSGSPDRQKLKKKSSRK